MEYVEQKKKNKEQKEINRKESEMLEALRLRPAPKAPLTEGCRPI